MPFLCTTIAQANAARTRGAVRTHSMLQWLLAWRIYAGGQPLTIASQAASKFARVRAAWPREESCTSYLLKERGIRELCIGRLVVRDGEEASHCKAPATWAAAAPATPAVLRDAVSAFARPPGAFR